MAANVGKSIQIGWSRNQERKVNQIKAEIKAEKVRNDVDVVDNVRSRRGGNEKMSRFGCSIRLDIPSIPAIPAIPDNCG